MTKEEILNDVGVDWEKLNSDMPLLSTKILMAMEKYAIHQLKRIDDYTKEETCDCTHTQACEICAESKGINWEVIND